MTYKTVTGTQESRPATLEVGKTTVYLRKNITQIEGEELTYWQYDECQMSREEYESKKDLIEELEEVKENQAIIMEALAAIYEGSVTNG